MEESFKKRSLLKNVGYRTSQPTPNVCLAGDVLKNDDYSVNGEWWADSDGWGVSGPLGSAESAHARLPLCKSIGGNGGATGESGLSITQPCSGEPDGMHKAGQH